MNTLHNNTWESSLDTTEGAAVSVVVQGPIVPSATESSGTQCTATVLKSVRQWLPRAELILSTWESSDYGGLDYDKLVLSVDPGAYPFNHSNLKNRTNNLNRMLVSTQAGINSCTRPLAIKLRTDTPIVKEPPYESITPVNVHGYEKYLSHRIVVSNIYTRNPLEIPMLFHLSDLVQFGLTEDLRLLWNAPLVREPEFTYWLAESRMPARDAHRGGGFLFRCAPEQYVIENLIKHRKPQVFLRYNSDGTVRQLFIWLRLLATHFEIVQQGNFFAKLPDRMEQHSKCSDLFQETHISWLKYWALPFVPVKVRFLTAVAYLEVCHRFTEKRRAKNLLRAIRNRLMSYR